MRDDAPPEVRVPIRALHPELGGRLPWPQRMSAQAAGFDLAAALDSPLTLPPGGRARVPLGFALALPAGLEAQIRPRSGLALRHGITCLNAPGTIDADYRGEVAAILVNHGEAPFVVEPGMRIAQMVVARVAEAVLEPAAALADSVRGAGGLGSTGLGSESPS